MVPRAHRGAPGDARSAACGPRLHALTGGDVFIVDKQLYASRYVDAALTVVSLASAPNGGGFYALVGARARSSMLTGVAARMLRGKVEKATRESTAMYLDWIKASLSASP